MPVPVRADAARLVPSVVSARMRATACLLLDAETVADTAQSALTWIKNYLAQARLSAARMCDKVVSLQENVQGIVVL
ncbi:hypothetical protein [Methylobacterium sp. SyP6R]|uniref:hypothetical protein n=1 Tax=Methylobacterium sp. SyP6R TaxID=2718876 RepID=UPI001F2AADF5|nr:hypothetical protein [Methylobacterium sp. SyP6R]MCF4129849.1 hypothetical protein [Methylobacterium sp. SyP6R]